MQNMFSDKFTAYLKHDETIWGAVIHILWYCVIPRWNNSEADIIMRIIIIFCAR